MDNTTTVISANIIKLRDALGLSQKDFALLTHMSAPTLVNIESGKKNFKVGSIDGILVFVNMKIADLSKTNFSPPLNLREKLMEKYKGNPEITVILDKAPSISYCIKHKLLTSKFLNNPRQTSEIKQYFEEQGWYFKGNSIHTALKRMPDLIEITKHPTKGNTNIYRKK